jgi:hypothetical protein
MSGQGDAGRFVERRALPAHGAYGAATSSTRGFLCRVPESRISIVHSRASGNRCYEDKRCQ